MSPSSDTNHRGPQRVWAVAALVLIGPFWPLPASALPVGSAAPVVPFEASVVLFAGGTAELDGSTTLERTRTGTRSRIDCTILFAKDSDRLRPGAGERLRRLASQLQQQGLGRIQVTGYTDDLGSAAHGLDLSRRRAQQVATALSATLPAKTFPMTVRGRGEASPAVPNTSENNRRKNRRVTVILNISEPSSAPPQARPSATTPPTPKATRTAAVPSAEASAPAPAPGPSNAPNSTEPSAGPPPAPATEPADAPPRHWPLPGAIGLALVLIGALVDQIRRRQGLASGPPPASPTLRRPSSDDTGEALTTGEQQDSRESAAAPPPVAGPNVAAASRDTPMPTDQADASTGFASSTVAVLGAQPSRSKASDLDADLTAWFSTTTRRPKLTLLGPVHARTNGQALARRKPYYTELLAYLTLKPHGATVDEIADTFSLTTARVRTDMKVLRDWLGHDPTTGQPYLPDARTSPAALSRGVPTYQVKGVLCDLLLLNQLHRRCSKAGFDGEASGIDTALALVSGRPFSQTRPNGWGWLFEGQRFDLQAGAAIAALAQKAAEQHHNDGNREAAQRALDVAETAGVR